MIISCLEALEYHARWLKGNPKGKRFCMPIGDFAGFDLTGANFENAYIPGANFSYTILTGVNFTGADLFGSCFANANLINARFNRADIRGSSFANADLTLADFTKADLRRGILGTAMINNIPKSIAAAGHDKPVCVDFTGATMIGTVMDNTLITYADAIVQAVSKNGAAAANTSMAPNAADSAAVKAAKVHARAGTLDYYLETDPNTDLTQEQRLVIANHQLWNATQKKQGKRGSLKEMDLSELVLEGMNVTGMDFSHSNLIGMRAGGANMSLCNFSHCDLERADFTKANLRGAAFRNSNLQHANFSHSDMRVASVQSSLDSKKETLWATIMMNCDTQGIILTGAHMDGIKLTGVDLQLSA